jgi:diguanylate cyclase (GGDEF)-like protein
MQYLGMAAILITPAIRFDPLWIAISVAIATVASFMALWLTFRLKSARHRYIVLGRLGASVVMGLAIAGMHYSGMAAARFPLGAFCRGGVTLDSLLFAISISIAACSLLVVTLITSVFDAHFEARAGLQAERLLAANVKLNYQATHDALTGIPNRVSFLSRLESAVSECGTAPQPPLLAVMVIDLDRFKIVNDSLGHGYGDRILQEATARLVSVLAEGNMVARLGGDGFLAMVRSHDTQEIIQTAGRIVQSLARVYQVDTLELHLTASVGATTYPFDSSEAEVLISHADEAMYQAKHSGGNGFRFFVPGTTIFTRERLELENDLRIAAQLNRLEVHYQPQVELISGRIVGFEALARWNHPIHGWIPPDEFIPLAEASDLILNVGRWVLESACKQTRGWHLQGFTHLNVAVNLSARQLRQPDLLSMIKKTVADNGLQPRHVDLELTETVVMSDAVRAIEVLEELHSAGFRVAVDDFGTGYSSMSYLKRLPVSKLKIDRSFVSDLGSSAKSDAIVRAVISLAHGLGMTVIAEGVETVAQRQILRSFGCDQLQGYLISRPKNVSDIAELLVSAPHALDDHLEDAYVDALVRGVG